MKSTTLYYRDGRSDKVYQAAIEPKNDLFMVTFAYGRRGATLQPGSKTPEPVPLDTAERIFDGIVREKMAKGYTLAEAGTPFAHSENAGKVSGIVPLLLNAITEEQANAFAKSPLWCMQQKMDGRRMLIKKEGRVIQGINRKGLFIDLPSQIKPCLYFVPGDFLIDGECVGVTFHAFDLLSRNGESWMKRGFQKRFETLSSLLKGHTAGNVNLVETHVDEVQKLAALKGLRECGAEGVVFRLLSAPYTPLRPAQGGTALKFKFTTTGSFIVAGVNGSRSVSLRVFDEDSLLGNVTIPPNHPIPLPDSVVEVRYYPEFRIMPSALGDFSKSRSIAQRFGCFNSA